MDEYAILAASAAAGERAAEEKLFYDLRDRARKLARGWFAIDGETEDAAMIAVERTFQMLHKFRGDSLFLTFFYRVALNRIKTEAGKTEVAKAAKGLRALQKARAAKALKKRGDGEAATNGEVAGDEEVSPADLVVTTEDLDAFPDFDHRPGPPQDYQRSSLREWLVMHSASLTGQQRDAIRLRYFGELSITELADVLGVSYNAAQSLIDRGKKALRKEALRSFAEGELSIEQAAWLCGETVGKFLERLSKAGSKAAARLLGRRKP